MGNIDTPDETCVTWGDFEVHFDKLLGRGGMGSVYRARQISLDRWVAVKILEPFKAPNDELAEGFLEKFDVEAKSLAKLHDARIITILQAGRHDGKCWYAMELVDGETIDQRITRAGMFEIREAARVAAEVARALQAALVQGIIHRDVKPANIFLTKDGGVKLGDFGLARSGEFKPTRFTEMNAVAATPEYASPEQAANGPCDHRSDQYSLGAVLFEMVTERPPFGGASAIETFFKHAHEEPPTPSKLNPAIPPHLESVILRCLRKEPADRFQDYAELIRELEAVATVPKPADPVAQPALPERKSFVLRAVGVVVVLGIGIVLVAGISRLLPGAPEIPQPPPPVAHKPPPVMPSPTPTLTPTPAPPIDEKAEHRKKVGEQIREWVATGKAIEALALMRREAMDVPGVVDAARQEAWIAVDASDVPRLKAFLELEKDQQLSDELAGCEKPLDHPVTRAFERAVARIYRQRKQDSVAFGEIRSWKAFPGCEKARWDCKSGLRISDPEKETWVSKDHQFNRGFTIRFRFAPSGDSSWCGLAVAPMTQSGFRMVHILKSGPKVLASMVTRSAGGAEARGEVPVAENDEHEFSIIVAESRQFVFLDGRLVGHGSDESHPTEVSIGVMKGEIVVNQLMVGR